MVGVHLSPSVCECDLSLISVSPRLCVDPPVSVVIVMGVFLLLVCVLRKCRALVSALLLLSLWTVLITVINVTIDHALTSSQRHSQLPALLTSSSNSDVTHRSSRAQSLVRHQDTSSLSRRHASGELHENLHEKQPPGFDGGSLPDQLGALAVLKTGIIGGRRIQEIKASELEGLEPQREAGKPQGVDTSTAQSSQRREGINRRRDFFANKATPLPGGQSPDLQNNLISKLREQFDYNRIQTGEGSQELDLAGGVSFRSEKRMEIVDVKDEGDSVFTGDVKGLETRDVGLEGGRLAAIDSVRWESVSRDEAIAARSSQRDAIMDKRRGVFYDRAKDKPVDSHFNSYDANSDPSVRAIDKMTIVKSNLNYSRPSANLYNAQGLLSAGARDDQDSKSSDGSENENVMQMDGGGGRGEGRGTLGTGALQTIDPRVMAHLPASARHEYPDHPPLYLERDNKTGGVKRSPPRHIPRAEASGTSEMLFLNRNKSWPRHGHSHTGATIDVQMRHKSENRHSTGVKGRTDVDKDLGEVSNSGAVDAESAAARVAQHLTRGQMEYSERFKEWVRRREGDKEWGRRLRDHGFELYSYNVTASDHLSLTREIPDSRPQG